MTTSAAIAGCAQYSRANDIPASPGSGGSELSPVEWRALLSLRRLGNRAMLHQHLQKRMRPAHGTQIIRDALRRLEALGLITHVRATAVQGRLQGAWIITDRGRAVVDAEGA